MRKLLITCDRCDRPIPPKEKDSNLGAQQDGIKILVAFDTTEDICMSCKWKVLAAAIKAANL